MGREFQTIFYLSIIIDSSGPDRNNFVHAFSLQNFYCMTSRNPANQGFGLAQAVSKSGS